MDDTEEKDASPPAQKDGESDELIEVTDSEGETEKGVLRTKNIFCFSRLASSWGELSSECTPKLEHTGSSSSRACGPKTSASLRSRGDCQLLLKAAVREL